MHTTREPKYLGLKVLSTENGDIAGYVTLHSFPSHSPQPYTHIYSIKNPIRYSDLEEDYILHDFRDTCTIDIAVDRVYHLYNIRRKYLERYVYITKVEILEDDLKEYPEPKPFPLGNKSPFINKPKNYEC